MSETPRLGARRGRTLKLHLVDGSPPGISPSGASATIAGRADNSKETWRVEGDGCSYAAWRASLIREEALA